jgi:hypothetical protein
VAEVDDLTDTPGRVDSTTLSIVLSTRIDRKSARRIHAVGLKEM